jgi:manganese-dependent ADP-ribose/CDP-alcohol diphosphatase
MENDSTVEQNRTTCVSSMTRPIKSFGLITDIHYADYDDGWNYSRTMVRRYRNSLKLVRHAIDHWRQHVNSMDFIIQLGDLIDGFCETNKTSNNDLEMIVKEFATIASMCPTYHIWGNHEFYNFTRQQLFNGPLRSFDMMSISSGHYGTWNVCSQLRIIAIDTYELSLLGIDKDDPIYTCAMNLLRQYNHNDNLNDPTGLDVHNQRYLQFNGGLTQTQLDWLKKQLDDAVDRHEKVIVVGNELQCCRLRSLLDSIIVIDTRIDS